MRRNIITTSDGSKTIQLVDWNEQYHSVHGALAEAQHVFLKNGLAYRLQAEDIVAKDKQKIHIVEMGLGTGLNLLLTYDFLSTKELDLEVNYTGIDKFPVSTEEQVQLNYEQFTAVNNSSFKEMCGQAWNSKEMYAWKFSLEKKQIDLIVDFCFSTLLEAKKIAPKAFALKTIIFFKYHEEWIKTELSSFIEQELPRTSPGLKATVRQILPI